MWDLKTYWVFVCFSLGSLFVVSWFGLFKRSFLIQTILFLQSSQVLKHALCWWEENYQPFKPKSIHEFTEHEIHWPIKSQLLEQPLHYSTIQPHQFNVCHILAWSHINSLFAIYYHWAISIQYLPNSTMQPHQFYVCHILASKLFMIIYCKACIGCMTQTQTKAGSGMSFPHSFSIHFPSKTPLTF